MPLHCLEILSPVSLAIPSASRAPSLLLFQSLIFFFFLVFTQMSPQWGLSLIILNATASQYPRFCFIFILLIGGVGGGLGANPSLLLNSKRVCCWLIFFFLSKSYYEFHFLFYLLSHQLCVCHPLLCSLPHLWHLEQCLIHDRIWMNTFVWLRYVVPSAFCAVLTLAYGATTLICQEQCGSGARKQSGSQEVKF